MIHLGHKNAANACHQVLCFVGWRHRSNIKIYRSIDDENEQINWSNRSWSIIV